MSPCNVTVQVAIPCVVGVGGAGLVWGMGKTRSRTERRAVVRRFHASGLSVRAFAAQEGVGQTTMCRWLAKARAAAGGPAFVEVVRRSLVAAADETGQVRVELSGRVQVVVGPVDPVMFVARLGATLADKASA